MPELTGPSKFDSMNKELINKINETPYKAFVTATGGGTSFAGEYHNFPGSSKTLLGSYIPYDSKFTDAFLGYKPKKYATEEVARKLAVVSYREALKVCSADLAIGLASSCSLVTEGEREGRVHRIHVATHTHESTAVYSGSIKQGLDRRAEERMVRKVMAFLLANACGADLKSCGAEARAVGFSQVDPNLAYLFDVHIDSGADILGNVNVNGCVPKYGPLVIYPGSFNPIHAGHLAVAELARKLTTYDPVFEISVTSVYKPELDYVDISRRTRGIRSNKFPLIISKAPRFGDKIKMLSEYFNRPLIFLMGMDVWRGFIDPKYYPLDELHYLMKSTGTKVIRFGRNGETVPESMFDEFLIEYDEAKSFDMKISSSELRVATSE